MDACNRHGESIVHISCRRGRADTLAFLLAHGGRVHMCDDMGRTPLHDACWAKTPVFDCISAILDQDPSLIRVMDCRGASPLAYIRREHWPAWRSFFDAKKEVWWKPLSASPSSAFGAGRSMSTDSSTSSCSSSGSVSSCSSSGSLAMAVAEGGDEEEGDGSSGQGEGKRKRRSSARGAALARRTSSCEAALETLDRPHQAVAAPGGSTCGGDASSSASI